MCSVSIQAAPQHHTRVRVAGEFVCPLCNTLCNTALPLVLPGGPPGDSGPAPGDISTCASVEQDVSALDHLSVVAAASSDRSIDPASDRSIDPAVSPPPEIASGSGFLHRLSRLATGMAGRLVGAAGRADSPSRESAASPGDSTVAPRQTAGYGTRKLKIDC